MSPEWVDQIKGLAPVRAVLGWIHRLTMAYDRLGMTKPPP